MRDFIEIYINGTEFSFTLSFCSLIEKRTDQRFECYSVCIKNCDNGRKCVCQNCHPKIAVTDQAEENNQSFDSESNDCVFSCYFLDPV